MVCRRIHNKSLMILSALGLAVVSNSLMANTVVEVRETADYLAISFEAEDHETTDDRWVLTDPTTPAIDPAMDPDPNHSDLAVGNRYIELLPDYRVTHNDPFVGPNGEQGLWNTPGTGPTVTYTINFPEAGRYYVHARALSTGTEDNGIHVGLDGEWPDSGKRQQFCTSGQGWKWSSRQRDSGGEDNPCGVDHTIWVTVGTPGEHTFAVSAREDGFELDRIMLIKDLSDNTRVCSAKNENSISCRDGSLENTDEVADVSVVMDSSEVEIDYTDTVMLGVSVENLDAYDNADNVTLSLDMGLGSRWTLLGSVDSGCEISDGFVECDLGLLGTSAPDDIEEFEFTLMPLMSGLLNVEATISTSTVDTDQQNNTASTEVLVTDIGRLSRLDARIAGSLIEWETSQPSEITASVENLGSGQALQARIEFTLADGLDAVALPPGCIGFSTIVCELGELAVDDVVTRVLSITADDAGMFSVSITANAENLDGEQPMATYIAMVVDAETEDDNENIEETEEPEEQEEVLDRDTMADNGSSKLIGASSYWLLSVLLLIMIGRRVFQPVLSATKAEA